MHATRLAQMNLSMDSVTILHYTFPVIEDKMLTVGKSSRLVPIIIQNTKSEISGYGPKDTR